MEASSQAYDNVHDGQIAEIRTNLHNGPNLTASRVVSNMDPTASLTTSEDYPGIPAYTSPQQFLYEPQPGQFNPTLLTYQIPPSPFGHQVYTPVLPNSPFYAAAPPTVRSRRKAGANGELVKHRRTRNGCFTCRNRRVKCDETRPTCQRCQKGGRGCTYPEPKASKAKVETPETSISPQVDATSSGEDEDQEEADEDSADDAAMRATGELFDEDGESPIIPSVASRSTDGSKLTLQQIEEIKKARTLEQTKKILRKVQRSKLGDDSPMTLLYLDYFHENINHYHYCLRYEDDDFLHKTLLDIAAENEALLYAVMAFSAYFRAVQQGDGKIDDFLSFHNKSVATLRWCIMRDQKPDVATLLTILQLATIEEYLGDWVSALSHTRAARQILTALYTSQDIMSTEMGRKLLQWFTRYDIIAGMLSGSGVSLPREWYTARHEYWLRVTASQSSDLTALYKERFAYNGIICADAATLWARRRRGEVEMEEFWARSAELEAQLTDWEDAIDPLLTDAAQLIASPPGSECADDADGAQRQAASRAYGGALWPSNIMMLEWWSFELMYKHQVAMMRGEQLSPALSAIAWKMFRLFEAMERCADRPPGILISVLSTVASAAVFMPKDEKNSLWVRRKLAAIETQGYTLARSFREKMGQHWGLDLTHWWLPDRRDEASYPPILGTVRSLIEDRSGGLRRDKVSEDLEDMRGIFFNLSLEGEVEGEAA